jgi:hypothetical protein
MSRNTLNLTLGMTIASLVLVSAQAPKNVLRVRPTPMVQIITAPNGLVTAVIGGPNIARGLGDFVFCMSYDKPLAQPINWSGPATVLYEVAGPIPGLEDAPDRLGIQAGVTVLPDDGNGWLFEGPGTKAPVRAEDQAKAAKATKVVTKPIRMAPTQPGRLSFCGGGPVGG